MSESLNLLVGAKQIAEYMFGDETEVSKIYTYYKNGTLPIQKLSPKGYVADREHLKKKAQELGIIAPERKEQETKASQQQGVVKVELTHVEIRKSNVDACYAQENGSKIHIEDLMRIERSRIAFKKYFNIENDSGKSVFSIDNKSYTVKVTHYKEAWLKIEEDPPATDFYIQFACDLTTDYVEMHGWSSREHFMKNRVASISTYNKNKTLWELRNLNDMSSFPLMLQKEKVA